MKIKMELVSDAIFGNGASIPGGEDIAIQCDSKGFPYYKGGTFKGIFREEYENYLFILGKTEDEVKKQSDWLFGYSGNEDTSGAKITFSDLELPKYVKNTVLEEIGEDNPQSIMEVFSHIRTFTKIDDQGMVQDGSLRDARCIDKGLCFYGSLKADSLDEEEQSRIKEVLGFVKFIGTMRNRGFGQVRITEVES